LLMHSFHLDKLVKQKTAELSSANKRLRKEIAEREKDEEALKELNDQLKKGKEELYVVNMQLVAHEQQLQAANEQLKASFIELQQSEMTQRQNERKFQQLVETMNEGFMVSDQKGCFTYVNDRLCEMLGMCREDFIGQEGSRFMDDENYKIVMKQVKKRHRGLDASYEVALTHRNSKKVFVIVSPKPTFDENGQYKGSLAVITDITKIKRTEEELKKTKDFLERVFESSRDGILISDEKGNIISANTAVTKMCRFAKEDLRGRHVSELVIKDEGSKKSILEKTRDLLEKGYATYEARYKDKDGNIVEVESISSMIKDEDGNYVAGVAIVRDVSERKKMERQLLQAEKLRSLGELSGGVAHDFNNVLAAILGRAQLMKKELAELTDNEVKTKKILGGMEKDLDTIEKAASDGAETVRRIQEFSRKREDDRYMGIADLENVVVGAIEFTKIRWKNDAEIKGIQYEIIKDFSSLPYIKGSTAELREVFVNLINNSLDAMPDGGTITIMSSRNEDFITVRVSDTGTGITKAGIGRVFDPFFTTKGLQSTGLGMSVSYGIINRHKGSINVESIEGKGTTFAIKLPLSRKTRKKVAMVESINKIRKASILIVEDEEGVRELLRDLLMCEGHRVEAVGSGAEAVDMFKQKKFDIVFTDLGMPGMSGWKVAEEIKKINSGTPVILVTGWEIMHRKEEIDKNGVDMVINKPFRMEQILQAVEKGMELNLASC